jgi:signal transduction histidine kinase
VHLDVELGPDVPLRPDLAQAIYRAVQEGLTNVHKHAHATEVDMKLCGASNSVTLEIHDDGVGATATANGHQPDSSGYGLVGLRERVALLDGQLSFGPSPLGGSCLRLTLPVRRTADTDAESLRV